MIFENIFIAITIPLVFINVFFIMNDNMEMKKVLYEKIQTNPIHISNMD